MNPRPAEFEYEFQQPIWSELKKFLLKNVFQGKCAYCESPLEFDRYMGDAEHFRPKGQVTVKDHDKKKRVQCVPYDGAAFDHPGYFWLAYDWRNLLPACSPCNSAEGKSDQFPANKHILLLRLSTIEKQTLELQFGETFTESPVGSGLYLLGPKALDAKEYPLLLRPLNSDPANLPMLHLRYGLSGTVVPRNRSAIGATSINVYNLKRDVLLRRRQEAQESMHRIYYGTLQDPGGDFDTKLDKALEPFRTGKKDFSSAALDYLDAVQRIQQRATKAAMTRKPESGSV